LIGPGPTSGIASPRASESEAARSLTVSGHKVTYAAGRQYATINSPTSNRDIGEFFH
jgi:hypothetical protein